MAKNVLIKRSGSNIPYHFIGICLEEGSLDYRNNDRSCMILILNRKNQYESILNVSNLIKERSKLHDALNDGDNVFLSADDSKNNEIVSCFNRAQHLSLCEIS